MGEKLPSLKWSAVGCVAGAATLLVVPLSAYDVDTFGFVASILRYVLGAHPDPHRTSIRQNPAPPRRAS